MTRMRKVYSTVCFILLASLQADTLAGAPYRLAAGDTLAVIVHGVVGKFGQAPVHFPKAGDDSHPAMGYPYAILSDGCLHLPEIDAVNVNNLTVAEAQRAVSTAYLDAHVLRKPHMVALTLIRKRQIHALVVHNNPASGRQSAESVKLSADQATVLAAVAEAGAFDRHASVRLLSPGDQAAATGNQIGDGVVIELRSPTRHYYFTGGLVAGGQFPLPVDGDLNVLQAIAAAGGYRQRGIIPPHQLTVLSRWAPTRSVPLAHVLANPNGFIVQPGDTLVVR